MENLGNYLKGEPVWFLELSLWLLNYCVFIEPSCLHCTTPKEKKSDPWHPKRITTRLCLKFKHTVFPRIIAGAIIRGILINFQSLNRRWSVLLDHLAVQPDKEVIKGREDDKRGGGDYSREAINLGEAIIRGNTVTNITSYKISRLPHQWKRPFW